MLQLETIEKAIGNDAERCQAATKNGPCPNKGALLSTIPVITIVNGEEIPVYQRHKYCRIHGANAAQQVETKKRLHNYILHRWNDQFAEKAHSSEFKNLRDEIAILRGLLEIRLEACNDNTDLILYSGALGDLITKIQKTVESCHRIETSMGQLMDKSQVVQFSVNIISIISETLKGDEEKIKKISHLIEQSLADVTESKLSASVIDSIPEEMYS